MTNSRISRDIHIFHGREAPEPCTLVGYGALIDYYMLAVPLPARLALISSHNRNYETEGWKVWRSRFRPEETLLGQLTFALKYEGIYLLLFKKLFDTLGPEPVTEAVSQLPTGQYSRRIWALYEWLTGTELPLPALSQKTYVPLVDEELQFALETGMKMERQRVLNNLPGNPDFCPMIRKTEKLLSFIEADLPAKTEAAIRGIGRDLLMRASSFLLLKDSKASFTIEGETPSPNRALRWGQAIGQAGSRSMSKEELERLQQIVIGSNRFTALGYRQEGGFIGEHDRETGEPIPDHISARWQDLERLMEGLIQACRQMSIGNYPAVLTAASVAFGFVFIHPFVDGNGRLHRYLIHHILATQHFSPPGIIFPVSAAILLRIDEYRKVLEAYSQPLLEFIEWKRTANNNVNVLNDTIDYYRYFDATAQAEFLYECVDYTIRKMIPEEVAWLQRRDTMKRWLDDRFDMPDKLTALLIRFLEQHGGKLSKRARDKELVMLTDDEVKQIEAYYLEIFGDHG